MESKRDDTVYLFSKINEIFAKTEVTQFFTNKLKNPIELIILFPIIEKLSLSKFLVRIDDKKIISKIMSKEKAEEKYNDSISSGNVGFISRYEEDNKSYSINIGNLQPNKKIELNSIFIQMIDSEDLSYQFDIMEVYPSFYYKEMKDKKSQNKNISANFTIETQSKLTRLIVPFLDKEIKNNCVFNIKYSQDYKKAEIKYKNDKEENNINKSFSILFRTENMNKPIIYSQYNPEKNETAYSINYTYNSKNLKEIPIPEKPDEDNTISYATKYEQNQVNETPGLFLFLIDQSLSMKGKSMELVKKTLLLFIQSLPKESYFQLIGFGSSFKKYNETPVIYNKENIKKIIDVINNLRANLGGTNITNPLKNIFNCDNDYSKINLSKNLFMLTDGYVDDRDECINLIKENSNKFRIHSIGLGNDFDKILIEKCGKLGKGSSSFVEDVENLNSVVIGILNKALRPYITNIKFEFENYKDEIDSNIISCNPINNFSCQNEIMNYSFILPGNTELNNLKIKITGKDPINAIEEKANFEKIIKIENGEEMSKMIVGKALKFNEEFFINEKKEIEFAKKYQILSKNTALFAEILHDENQKSKLIKVNLTSFNEYSEEMKIGYNQYKINSNNFNPFSLFPSLSPHSNQFKDSSNMNNISNPYISSQIMNNNFQMNSIDYNPYGPSPHDDNPYAQNDNPYGPSPQDNNPYAQSNNPYDPSPNDDNPYAQHNNPYGPSPQDSNPYAQNNNPFGPSPQDNNPYAQNDNPFSPSPQDNNQFIPLPLNSMENKNIMMNSPQTSNSFGIYSKETKNNKSSEINLIMCQDALDGFWEENEETKKLIDIIFLDKFNKIKNKIIALNKGENEIKIIYTILVVYYLKTNLSMKLNEYILVINKANKFLKENGVDYNNIVSDI